jgi:hypothetical protein
LPRRARAGASRKVIKPPKKENAFIFFATRGPGSPVLSWDYSELGVFTQAFADASILGCLGSNQ